MSIINITIPFALITWAEQSVDSALAAILNSTVPLFVIVLAPLFLPDEPIRINGILGLMIGFLGVVLIVSPGLAAAAGTVPGQIALLGSSLSYAVGNVYSRRSIQGQPPMIPAVFQVTFALLIVGALALVIERPWATATPDAEAWFSVIWLGILGSGLAYLAYFRLLLTWGATRTALVAYLLPVVGIVLGFLVRREPIDATLIAGTGLVIAGVALVNGRWGRRRLFAPLRSRRSPPEPGTTRRQPATARSTAPATISTEAPIRRAVSPRSTASPSRTEPQAAANTAADSRSGATPDSGATLKAQRISR